MILLFIFLDSIALEIHRIAIFKLLEGLNVAKCFPLLLRNDLQTQQAAILKNVD